MGLADIMETSSRWAAPTPNCDPPPPLPPLQKPTAPTNHHEQPPPPPSQLPAQAQPHYGYYNHPPSPYPLYPSYSPYAAFPGAGSVYNSGGNVNGSGKQVNGGVKVGNTAKKSRAVKVGDIGSGNSNKGGSQRIEGFNIGF